MSKSATSSALSSQVLIYPNSLEFYLDDSKSHQQYATLYNQYDFPIKYKILSTAPKKYTVTDPEGTIDTKSSFDLIVKHQSSGFLNENVNDKLRIQIYHCQANSSGLISKKDIPLYSIVNRKEHFMTQIITNTNKNQPNLMTGSVYLNDSQNEDQLKYSLSSFSYGNSLSDMMALNANEPVMRNLNSKKQINKEQLNKKAYLANQTHVANADNVNYLVILIGLICLTILFVPLVNTNQNAVSNTNESYLPTYLHVSYEIKLFCSFVLGMVTMVILKN